MIARIIPVIITDFARTRTDSFFSPTISVATYRNAKDKNIFRHSKIPSARLIALDRERTDIIK